MTATPGEPASPGDARVADDGRSRVLDAAVECILDTGYRKASTNEIARRAGVTWGALQYHFGSREALFLAVLTERWHALQVTLADASIEGATLEARLACVLDALATYYGQPAHLAQLQILLDLSRNPDTSAETRAAVAEHGRLLVQAWEPLFAAALGDAACDRDLVRYAFTVLRGYLTGYVVASSISDIPDDRVVRDLLVRGVAAAIREEATIRGLALPDGTP